MKQEKTLMDMWMETIELYNLCYIIQIDKFAYVRPALAKNYFDDIDTEEDLVSNIEFMPPTQMNKMVRHITNFDTMIQKDWVEEFQKRDMTALTLQDYKWQLADVKDIVNYESSLKLV